MKVGSTVLIIDSHNHIHKGMVASVIPWRGPKRELTLKEIRAIKRARREYRRINARRYHEAYIDKPENKARILEIQRRYREENRDKIRAYQRDYMKVSGPRRISSGFAWSSKEIAMVMAHSIPDKKLARKIKRSLGAIYRKRRHVKYELDKVPARAINSQFDLFLPAEQKKSC